MTPGARVAGLVAIALVASAHVGSPDTYYEGPAGPYRVRVIVRSPGVVPGLAQITVRLIGGPPGPRASVTVLPVYWDPRTAAPPPADTAQVVPGDSTLYDAALWLMAGGSYSVRVRIDGPGGSGLALVPVQAVATRRLGFETGLGVGLAAAGLFLVAGLLTIVGAAVREAVLPPGEAPDQVRLRRARISMVVGALVLAVALAGGRRWWRNVDDAFAAQLYRPLHATATVRQHGAAPVLHFAIDDSTWLDPQRPLTPLVPDHGHLMHLFLVHDSSPDAFAHLHPLPLDSSNFEATLPPLPAGRYRVYGDIVRESGFAETLTDTVDLVAAPTTWRASDPDDAWWTDNGERKTENVVTLTDGSTMTWERGDAPFRFVVRAPDGRPATLEPYMGMAGHLMLTRDDGSVFVHLHPLGTISWAAQQTFVLRGPADTVRGAVGRRMTEHDMRSQESGVGSEGGDSGIVAFPYAFPKPGRYALWVQVKRNGRILTAHFDATAS